MKKLFLLLSCLVLTTPGCEVVNQVQQAANLAKCDFRIVSAENLTLAGVNIQNVNSLQDLSFMTVAKIMSAVAGSTFPLTFTLNFEGKNPNPSPAGLNRLDWILFIDDIQMTQGILDKAFTIPPDNGTTIIPLQLNIDLKKALQGKSLDAIANFAFNLAGVGSKPTRIMAKLKPTILVGNSPVTYPGYITVKTEYSGIR
jgi:LEA14-like dessication related protein